MNGGRSLCKQYRPLSSLKSFLSNKMTDMLGVIGDVLVEARSLSSRRWFGLLSPRHADLERAALLYSFAGRHQVLTRNWALAAASYKAEAECCRIIGKLALEVIARTEQINMLLTIGDYDAAHSVLVSDVLLRLYEVLSDGTWSHKILAFAHRFVPSRLDLALDIFIRCDPIAAAHGHTVLAYNCQCGAMSVLAQLARYTEAAELAERCFRNGPVGPGEFIFRPRDHRSRAAEAILIHLANSESIVSVRAKEDELLAMDAGLRTDLDWMLATRILQSVETADLSSFNYAVHTYDAITPFPAWIKPALLSIKGRITGVVETEL